MPAEMTEQIDQQALDAYVENVKEKINNIAKEIIIEISKVPNKEQFSSLINLYQQAAQKQISALLKSVTNFQGRATAEVARRIEEQELERTKLVSLSEIFRQDFSQIQEIIIEIVKLNSLLRNIYEQSTELKENIPEMFFAKLFPSELFNFIQQIIYINQDFITTLNTPNPHEEKLISILNQMLTLQKSHQTLITSAYEDDASDYLIDLIQKCQEALRQLSEKSRPPKPVVSSLQITSGKNVPTDTPTGNPPQDQKQTPNPSYTPSKL